jgi:glyceraldehyde 3-phosphate dehydrogenase
MAIRVGINGFGRIGRNVFRILENDPAFEVVAINDLGSDDMLAYLLQYDSVHGRFKGTVSHGDRCLIVNGREVKVYTERDPASIPWGKHNVDFAVESTGIFTSREACSKHLAGGAKKVLLTVPPKDAIDAVVVMGVNQEMLKKEHRIISNASCTTNCLAPMAKVLNDAFGIDHGLITTIHAYTNDQRVLDVLHSDPRRARAAALNIIPTSTGAAKAVGQVIPELNGRLHGMALRVPVPDGSATDLVATLKKDVTTEEVNAALKAASDGPMKGILRFTLDPIVSSDIVGDPASSIIDGLSTMVMQKRMVKVLSWYDNEWGYSNRCRDLMHFSHSL